MSVKTEERPRVGLGVIVRKGDRILLGRRKGSHGAGQYASPGGHLEHLEGLEACCRREVREETGLEIHDVRFLRVMNVTEYAPRHYVDLSFVAEWASGEPEVREPDKVEGWDWYPLDALPSPLFATMPSALAALRGELTWLDAKGSTL
ncbi:MAG: NUDIX domain-containing protein [Labilithrix sp.]